MRISEYMRENLIFLDVEAKGKIELLRSMADRVALDNRISDAHAFIEEVLVRERLESTGIGDGFALPHARTDKVTDIFIAFVRIKEPIEYKSVDDKAVQLLFLIGTPVKDVQNYLKLLAKLTRLLKKEGMKHNLSSAKTAKEVLEIISAAD